MKKLLFSISMMFILVSFVFPLTTFAATTQINGSDVMIIGDSYFALSGEITKSLERQAKEAGILGTNDSFRDCSVFGATLAQGGYARPIPDQYKNALSSGKVKYVIMDGGGNDCLNSGSAATPYNESTPYIKNATDEVTSLLKQMKADGVIKVFYLFYPNPNGDLGGLKGKLDALRPIMQSTVANAAEKPDTYFFDVRPVWDGNESQYTLSDGIHPTTAGSEATATGMWTEMQKYNFFGTSTPIPTTQIKGSDLMIIGDSFFALSDEITKALEKQAKDAGILGINDNFRDCAVSGSTLKPGGSVTAIPDQYKNALSSGKVKYVIMDGGGNDCLQSGGDATPYTASTPYIKNATDAVNSLLKQMKADGVVKVFYLFYPNPNADLGGLKAKLDALRPIMQSTVANAAEKPETYFFDVRPVWDGNASQYTLPDGIHPTTAGSNATAQGMWTEMQKYNFFDTSTPTITTLGDLNNDKILNISDYILMKRYILNINTSINSKAADLNGDSIVNVLDSTLLKQYLLHQITSFPVIIPNGTTIDTTSYYKIVLKNNPACVLTCSATPGNGINVQASKDLGTNLQQWKLSDAGNGYYKISVRANESYFIDESETVPVNGSNVQMWLGYEGSDRQQWKPVDVGGGYYEIQIKANPTFCLDGSQPTPYDISNAQVWTYKEGNGSQQWSLVPVK